MVQYPLAINQCTLNMMAEYYFTQLVDSPTHHENIIDKVFANCLSLINCCTVIPGISDHDGVLISFTAKVHYQSRSKHKCYLWNRANIGEMREILSNFSMWLCDHYSVDTSVDFLWSSIQTKLIDLLDEYVPSKMVAYNNRQPWINRYIKQLSRRKQRCYNRAKENKLASEWAYYKLLKKRITKRM